MGRLIWLVGLLSRLGLVWLLSWLVRLLALLGLVGLLSLISVRHVVALDEFKRCPGRPKKRERVKSCARSPLESKNKIHLEKSNRSTVVKGAKTRWGETAKTVSHFIYETGGGSGL